MTIRHAVTVLAATMAIGSGAAEEDGSQAYICDLGDTAAQMVARAGTSDADAIEDFTDALEFALEAVEAREVEPQDVVDFVLYHTPSDALARIRTVICPTVDGNRHILVKGRRVGRACRQIGRFAGFCPSLETVGVCVYVAGKSLTLMANTAFRVCPDDWRRLGDTRN